MLKVMDTAPAVEEGGLLTDLDEIARQGAQRMLATALKAEVAAYLETHRGERDERGHARVVRNGRARPRKVTIGSGTLEVAAPRVNRVPRPVTGSSIWMTLPVKPVAEAEPNVAVTSSPMSPSFERWSVIVRLYPGSV